MRSMPVAATLLAEPLDVPRRVRVLHVITGLGVGGAEAMLASLVVANAPALEQSVVSLLPNGFHAPRLRAKGVEVTELAFNSMPMAPVQVMRLAALIDRVRPDVVQGWMYHGNVAALAAVAVSRRRRETRVAWGIRCSDGNPADESRQLRGVVRLGAPLARFCDILVANSNAGLAHHVGLGYRCRRSMVVHNGIDTRRFRPDAEARAAVRKTLGFAPDDVVLAHVARVHPMKDHATLIDALRKLPNIKAIVVGVGTEGLPSLPNVRALGRRDDVPRLLAACDIVVSSSAFGEGFSNALAEGMASSLIPVATDVGDSKIIVGDTGTVVSPRSPAALSSAIASFATMSDAERNARGARARDRIQSTFTLENAVHEFEQLYEDLAGEPKTKLSWVKS